MTDAQKEPSWFRRDRAKRKTHVPDRDDLRLLLQRYFVGPISDAHVDRLHRKYVEAREREYSADRARFESIWDFRGRLWNEDFHQSPRREMDPIDHALYKAHMQWYGDSANRGILDPFPRPKFYCPSDVVGTWEQVEPSTSEPTLWRFDADDSFHSNSAEIPSTMKHWCVHKDDDPDERYVALGSVPDSMSIGLFLKLEKGELVGTTQRDVRLRLRRVHLALERH